MSDKNNNKSNRDYSNHEEQCRKSFSNFFDNVTLAVYLMNEEGEFIAVNKYAEKMYGYDADYFIGKTPDFLSAPGRNDMEKVREYHRKAFAGEPQRFFFWGKRRNGEVFYKEVRMHKAKFIDEDVLIVTGEDITKQYKLKEKARLSEERYKTILDNTHDAIIIIQDEKIVFGNNKVKELLGYSLEEILFKPFESFLTNNRYKEKLKEFYLKRISGPENQDLPEEYTIEFTTKNGEIKYLSIRPTVIPWGETKAIMEIIQDITGTEKEKKEKETIKKIIANSSNIFFEWENENGTLAYVTDNIKKILGYDPEEFYNKTYTLLDIIHPDDKENYLRNIKKYKKPGIYQFAQHYRVKKKDGQYIRITENTTVEIEKYSLSDKKIYGIASEITDSDLLKEIIKQQEKNYQAVLENTHDALVVTKNSKIVFANKSLTKLIGYSFDEVVGQNMRRFIHPEDYPTVADRHARRLKGDVNLPVNYDFRLISKSGTIVWVKINPVVVNWENEKATFGFLRDITKEKEVFAELERSELKYRSIIENMTEGITIIDENFKLLYYNPAFANIVNAERSSSLELLDITKIVHDEDVEKFYTEFKNALAQKKSIKDYEIRIRTFDNKIKWISIKSINVDWEEKPSLLSIISDITEQKEAIEKLRQNEQILENLINSAKEDIICFKDGKGRWLKANTADLELFQLTGVDYYGKTDAELAEFSPFYRDAFLTCMETDEACWRKGVTTRGDEIIPLPTGESKIYDVIKTPVFNPDGTRNGLIVFGRDVTEQRKAEKELRIREQRYKTLIDNLHEAILVTQDGIIKYFNKSFIEISGYDEKEVHDEVIVQFIHPEDRTYALDINDEGFNMHLDTEPYEFRLIRKNNSPLWVLNRAIEIEWDNEKAVMSFIRNISKEKQALEEINKLSVAVEQSEQGFIILDSEIKIEYANPYIYKLFNMDKEDLLGKSPEILSPKGTDESWVSQIVTVLAEEETWQGELRFQRKNGELFWGYMILTPIKNSKDELTNFLIIIIDIDNFKKIQEELEKAKILAEKSDKMKTNFLMQVSHEIRTPLNTITSSLGVIEEELVRYFDDDLEKLFSLIKKAVKRLIRTIDLMLELGSLRIDDYKFIPQDINADEIINSLLLTYLPETQRKKLSLTYENKTDDPILPARDQHSIRQIFDNLINNAVKFTDKGYIRIELGRNENNELYFSITDTGLGINRKKIDYIFQPFSQEDEGTKRRFEGVGLGLPIVKEYANLNNAKIEVTSRKGEGSTFKIIFSNEIPKAAISLP